MNLYQTVEREAAAAFAAAGIADSPVVCSRPKTPNTAIPNQRRDGCGEKSQTKSARIGAKGG